MNLDQSFQTPTTLDQAKVDAFVGEVVGDMAAAMSGVMVNLGHKLDLYRAMANAGALTPVQLARRSGHHERYVREWLNNQVAGGYVEYDPAARTYTLPAEHAAVLADPDSPTFLVAGFDVVSSLWHDEDQVADAFRSGDGIGWHQHHPRLVCGTEARFPPGYRAMPEEKRAPAARSRKG